MTLSTESFRILIVDDNQAIHDDFEKILSQSACDGEDVLEDFEDRLFGEVAPVRTQTHYRLDHAFQGREGYEMVRAARAENAPYSMAFVDVRMPPGWDGVETVQNVFGVDGDIQLVLCTAHSDHSWQTIIDGIEKQDALLILKKPFDAIEVQQLAYALCGKWKAQRTTAEILRDLEELVQARTAQLEEEMARRHEMESERRLAQKLESIGQLAAGIAHEINTPIQYVGDNTRFLKDAFRDILDLVARYREGRTSTAAAGDPPSIAEFDEETDLDYLREEIPRSIESTLEGVQRVTEIVRSLKEFAHPDPAEKTRVDVNRAIRNTLAVCVNEYKYVAEVELDLGEVPEILCNRGELSQVILNLVVNGAQAIADAKDGSTERGVIGIRTRAEGEQVAIAVSDNGGGIPEEIAARIFDPFFTTKEVGRGTGQGLAISRSVVVDKHGGSLQFDSEPGRGTTFTIRLPMEPAERL